jgi:hypothetical protein
VTIFGIFFTPVFYVVIRWLTGQSAAPRAGAGLGPGDGQAATPATADGAPAKHAALAVAPAEGPNEKA